MNKIYREIKRLWYFFVGVVLFVYFPLAAYKITHSVMATITIFLGLIAAIYFAASCMDQEEKSDE